MGGRTSKNEDRKGPPPKPEVGFDDFEVLRAIGRGSFGKVRFEHLTLRMQSQNQEYGCLSYMVNFAST